MGMRPWGYMQGEAMEVGPEGGCHGNEATGIYAGGREEKEGRKESGTSFEI